MKKFEVTISIVTDQENVTAELVKDCIQLALDESNIPTDEIKHIEVEELE